MAKDERLYAPFDIGMDEHPKIVGLTDAAFRAFYEGIFYARRMMSDGFLDKRIVLRRWGQEVADELSSNDPERPSWVPVDNGWQIRDFANHHPLRAEIEEKRAKVSEAKSAAGRKSGEVRRAKAEQAANTHEQTSNRREQETNELGTKVNPETETETKTKTTSSNELVRVSDADFEQAWAFWPKKVERKKAAEMFKRVAKKLGTQELIQHVHVYGTAYAETTDRQFVPALDVWLRNERWTDELPRHPSRTQPQRLTRADENALEFERLYGGDQHGGTRSVQALDAGFGS